MHYDTCADEAGFATLMSSCQSAGAARTLLLVQAAMRSSGGSPKTSQSMSGAMMSHAVIYPQDVQDVESSDPSAPSPIHSRSLNRSCHSFGPSVGGKARRSYPLPTITNDEGDISLNPSIADNSLLAPPALSRSKSLAQHAASRSAPFLHNLTSRTSSLMASLQKASSGSVKGSRTQRRRRSLLGLDSSLGGSSSPLTDPLDGATLANSTEGSLVANGCFDTTPEDSSVHFGGCRIKAVDSSLIVVASPTQPSEERILAAHGDCPQPLGEMDALDAYLLGPAEESALHILSSSGALNVGELPNLFNRRGDGGGGGGGIGSTISILEPSEYLVAGNGSSRAASKVVQVATMQLQEVVPQQLGLETDLEDGGEGVMEGEDVQVWHEITAKPFVHPSTGQRAILLMQNDVTTRVRAENILAGLSEGQVSNR